MSYRVLALYCAATPCKAASSSTTKAKASDRWLLYSGLPGSLSIFLMPSRSIVSRSVGRRWEDPSDGGLPRSQLSISHNGRERGSSVAGPDSFLCKTHGGRVTV